MIRMEVMELILRLNMCSKVVTTAVYLHLRGALQASSRMTRALSRFAPPVGNVER